jgi:hypothetical protein
MLNKNKNKNRSLNKSNSSFPVNSWDDEMEAVWELPNFLGRVDERHRGRSRSFSRLWCGGRAVWLRVI